MNTSLEERITALEGFIERLMEWGEWIESRVEELEEKHSIFNPPYHKHIEEGQKNDHNNRCIPKSR